MTDVAPAIAGLKGYALVSDSAPVEVVEYVDYECPICAIFATVQFPTIKEQLIATGKVRWRSRDYPLRITGHPNARYAALGAGPAVEQVKFSPIADIRFDHHH